MSYSHQDLAEIQGFLDVPQFLLGDVAYTAGLSTAVLKAWLSRPPVIVPLGASDMKALGKGSARILTLRRVINICVTAELVRLGLTPKHAGAMSFHITDVVGMVTSVPSPSKRARVAPTRSPLDPVNIWARNDVLILASRNKDSAYPVIGDVVLFDVLHQLGKQTDGDDIQACLVVDFSGIYQKALSKLKERMKL
jgi:hypothetical protein